MYIILAAIMFVAARRADTFMMYSLYQLGFMMAVYAVIVHR